MEDIVLQEPPGLRRPDFVRPFLEGLGVEATCASRGRSLRAWDSGQGTWGLGY